MNTVSQAIAKAAEHAHGTTTGGRRARQIAQMMNIERECLYGRIGFLSHEFDAGGPLDAPDILPTGSINSTEWCDGRGNALAMPSETHRWSA